MKLTKTQLAERDRIIKALEISADKVSSAIENYNAAVGIAFLAVTEAEDEYNATIREAIAFAEDIASELEVALDDKSDRWRESGRGQSCQSFADEWAGVSLSEIDTDAPVAIDVPDMDAASIIEAMPEAAD